MSAPILILTEVALGPSERKAVEGLLEGGGARLEVLVPTGRKRRLVVDFLDHLSMLEFGKAVGGLTDRGPSPEAARALAQTALATSLAALEGLGADVSGSIVEGDPVQALADRAAAASAEQAVVVTLPHAVEDTFHTDWANQAQRKLGIPVLHLYAGTGFIGDS
jgi:phosphoglycolate phosphatase-like HAD superfamily hydrolase